MSYYIQRGNAIFGPFDADAIRHAVATGRVKPDTRITADRGETWEPLSQVPELIPDGSLAEFAAGVNFAPGQTPGQTPGGDK